MQQVIFALPSDNGSTDYDMRIYNCDGTEPEMCGNGIRCLARFVADRDGSGACQHRVNTLAGASVQTVLKGRVWQRGPWLPTMTHAVLVCAGLIQPAIQEDGQVCVDMGEPVLEGARVPTTLPPTQVRAASPTPPATPSAA